MRKQCLTFAVQRSHTASGWLSIWETLTRRERNRDTYGEILLQLRAKGLRRFLYERLWVSQVGPFVSLQSLSLTGCDRWAREHTAIVTASVPLSRLSKMLGEWLRYRHTSTLPPSLAHLYGRSGDETGPGLERKEPPTMGRADSYRKEGAVWVPMNRHE